jgi:hypothetical protein
LDSHCGRADGGHYGRTELRYRPALANKPGQNLGNTIDKAWDTFIKRKDVILNPSAYIIPTNETKWELKYLADRLKADLSLVRCYPISALIFRLPCRANIDKAAQSLEDMSNGLDSAPQGSNSELVAEICRLLKIPQPR